MGSPKKTLSRSIWQRLALRVMVSALLPLAVHAQLTVGHVTGTVTDSANSVVPGADVTLTNTGTNISQHTLSTSTGSYTFEQVDPGTYSLRVEAKGFSAAVTSGIIVHVQQTVTQNYELSI